MGAVIVQDLHDLCNPERAGKRKAACFKPGYMLETPKALLYQYSKRSTIGENQGDITMGNQQERPDVDFAWLAGFIEGEGWVSLGLVQSLKPNGVKLPAYVPNIGATNTDARLTDFFESVLSDLNIKFRKQIRKPKIGSDGISRKERIEISVTSHVSVFRLAQAVLPYMKGEKKERVKKLIKFIELRQSKCCRGIKGRYGEDEHKIYQDMYSFKGKSRSGIPNDYTPGSQYSDKI